MSDIESKEFLRLILVCFDLSTDVLRAYAEKTLISPQYGSSFIRFLDYKKHVFYHLWQSCISCCECSSKIKPCQKEMQDWMFFKLYSIQTGIPCSKPHTSCHTANGKIQRHCLCRVLAIQTLTLEDLDINILTFLLKRCSVSNTDVETINSLRGKLCHAISTKSFVKTECEMMWKDFEDSILSLATGVDAHYLKAMKNNLKWVKKCEIDKEEIKKLVSEIEEQSKIVNQVKEHADKLTKEVEDLRSGQSVIKQEVTHAAYENRQNVQKMLEETKKSSEKLDFITDILLGKYERKDSSFTNSVSLKDSAARSNNQSQITGKTDIGVQVDFRDLNEERTIQRLENKTDDQTPYTFHLKTAEQKCILLDMTAEKEIFQSEEAFKFAIDNLIDRIIEAGEIDTTQDKTMKITLTFKSQISDEQRKVVYSMLSKYGVLYVQDKSRLTESETTPSALTMEQVENQETIDIKKVGKGLIPKTHGHWIQDTENPFIKSEIISDITDFDDRTMITAEKLIFHLRVKELPEKFQDLETESSISETDDGVCYVEWKWICPNSFDVEDTAYKIRSKIPELRDWFEIEYVSEDMGVITLQTKTPVHTFASKTSMDTAIRYFLLKTTELCSIPTADAMSISVDVTVLSGLEESEGHFSDSDENDEPEAKKRKTLEYDTQKDIETAVTLTQRFVDYLKRNISSLQNSLKEPSKKVSAAKIRQHRVELDNEEINIWQNIISLKILISQQKTALSACKKVLDKEKRLPRELNFADVDFNSDWLLCSVCKNIKPHKETYLCRNCDKNICVHCYCARKYNCTLGDHRFILDTTLLIYNELTTFTIGPSIPMDDVGFLRYLGNNDLIYNSNRVDDSTVSIIGTDGRLKRKFQLSYRIYRMDVIDSQTILVIPVQYKCLYNYRPEKYFYVLTITGDEPISNKINIPIGDTAMRTCFYSRKLYISCTACIKIIDLNGLEVGRIDFPDVEQISVFDNNLYCYQDYKETLTHYDLNTNTVCTSVKMRGLRCMETDSEGNIFMGINHNVCQADRNIQNLRIVLKDRLNEIKQLCIDTTSQHLITLDFNGRVTVYKKTNVAER